MLLNVNRADRLMADAGVEALIATSPVNVTYITGYFSWLDPLFQEFMGKPGASSALPPLFAVLPRHCHPAIVVSPIFVANAAHLPELDLYSYGDSGIDESFTLDDSHDVEKLVGRILSIAAEYRTAVDALVAAVKQYGLEESSLAIEWDGLPLSTRNDIQYALPRATFRDCSNLLRYLRAVKTGDEIDRLRSAAEISELAFTAALREARLGTRISDIRTHYRVELARAGADFDHFAYSPHGMGISTEPDHVLCTDDVMYIDFGCKYEYVFSDSGTTLVATTWPRTLERLFRVIRESMDAGINALRPGVRASSVQQAMKEVMTEHSVKVAYPHGHSLGLAVRDYPILVPSTALPLKDDCIDVNSDLALEPNMVVNLEAPVFVLGLGSVHIEQTLLVTDHGAEPLTEQNRTHPSQLNG